MQIWVCCRTTMGHGETVLLPFGNVSADSIWLSGFAPGLEETELSRAGQPKAALCHLANEAWIQITDGSQSHSPPKCPGNAFHLPSPTLESLVPTSLQLLPRLPDLEQCSDTSTLICAGLPSLPCCCTHALHHACDTLGQCKWHVPAKMEHYELALESIFQLWDKNNATPR